MLAPEDSGTQQAPIVWSAYGDEHPTLSGGARITGWAKTTVNGHEAWVAKIPENGSPAPFRELWLEGKRLARARWPKQGTLEVVGLSDTEKHDDWTHGSNQFRYATNAVEGLADGHRRRGDRRQPLGRIAPAHRLDRRERARRPFHANGASSSWKPAIATGSRTCGSA